MSLALVTIDEVNQYLGQTTGDDATQDALIEDIIGPGIEDAVQNFCDTNFSQVVVGSPGERHDGNRSDVIVPANVPIISVQAVFMYVPADSASGGIALDADDYFVDTKKNVIVLKELTTPFHPRGNILIQYTYGYAAVPGVVKLAIFENIKASIQRRNRNVEDVSSRSKGGETESYGGAFDSKSGLLSSTIGKLKKFQVIEFPSSSMAQRNY